MRTGASPAAPIWSPKGHFEARTRINPDKSDRTRYLCVIIEIRDASGTLVHGEVTPASDCMRWSLAWADDETLRLKSSDVGIYTLHREKDGTWKGNLGGSATAPAATAPAGV